MQNIKITYSYDGSNFFGFQRQPFKRTVQGELEKILSKIFKQDINLISSGRTDRGVHAKMQVSNFMGDMNFPPQKLKYILNRGLPEDINILNVEIERDDFNARFDVKRRHYEYILSMQKDPFRARYEGYIDKNIDCKKLNEILQQFVGVFDFNVFRTSDCGSKTSIREIYEIDTQKIDEYRIKIHIVGNAFLKSQIRIMVQTALLEYFNGGNLINERLNNPTKKFIKKVASPNGLYLSKIEY